MAGGPPFFFYFLFGKKSEICAGLVELGYDGPMGFGFDFSGLDWH